MKSGLHLGLAVPARCRLLVSHLRPELLLDEFLQTGEVSVPAVLHSVLLLRSALEELESGVASHVLGRAEGRLLGAVHLPDGDLLLLVHLAGELLPGGRQSLAVSTPGGVEHDEVRGGGHLAHKVPLRQADGGDGLLGSPERPGGEAEDKQHYGLQHHL